ncbi:phage tail length tape measure family protein [Martelella limonii]|uniref:phage tail length tape measure family protein n=1 Tax=Martelella limonii TaxID=1647649 RepID=UPI0015811061|nr:phage tail length tape measure family protein [Martelella limonii]
MAKPMKASILLTADASSAKRELRETRDDFSVTGKAAVAFGGDAARGFTIMSGAAGDASSALQNVIAASTGLGRASAGLTAANTSLAAFGMKLDDIRASYSPLFAAERTHTVEIERIDEAYRRGAISIDEWVAATAREETANRNAVNAIRQRQAAYDHFVDTSFREQTDALLGVTGERARSSDDIAAYAAKLDALQAQFDPLFAAQQRYLQAIERIDEAERAGVITASRAIDIRLKERNALDAVSAAADRSALARKRATEALVGSVTIVPDRGADIAAFGAELDRQRAKYNPLFAAITRYRQEIAEIREAQLLGAISTDEMTAAISRQRQATLSTIDAIKGRNPLGREGLNDNGARFRRQNLTYQLFDIGQTAAMGMNPAMIFAQQGPQIVQLYAGQGGVNMALKDFGSILGGLTRLINPVTLGIGGLTAAVGIGAVAYGSYLSSTKAVETAASGLGRAVAGTASEMEASARAGAAAAGISVGAARSMEAAFLRTGTVGSENFEGLIGISRDFAATIGASASEAGDALAEMFSDPAKAADTLSRQYNLIDAATARQVRNLAAQNRLVEAQALILDSLPGKLANAEQSTTALGRAFAAMRTDVSNAFGFVGGVISRGIDGLPPEAELERLKQQQRDLYAELAKPGTGLLGDNIQKMLDRPVYAEIAEVEERIGQLQSLLNAQEEKSSEAQARQRVTAASTVADASPALSTINQIEAYRNQIAALRSGIGSLTAADIDAGEGDRLNKALEAKERALDGLLTKQQRLGELDQLDIRIANEKNPLLRAEIEARRKRIELQGQEISQAETEAEVARTYARVIESTIAGGQAQISQINTETEIRAGLNAEVAAGTVSASEANRILQEELQLRPLIAAAAEAEGAEKQRLEAIVNGLREAYAAAAAEARKAANAQALLSGDQELARLDRQIGLIGASEAVRRRELAVLQEQQKLQQEGYGPDDAEYAARIEQARKIADAETALSQAEGNRDAIRTRQERIAGLKAELELTGATSAERRRAIAVLEEQQQLTREGIALDSEVAQSRLALAAAEAEIASAVERAEASRDRALSRAESLEQLRAEVALLGASESVRRRELAVLEEMQAMRREGVVLGSEEARQRVENVRILADETSALERMRDVWGEVRSVGESALDAVLSFDDLRKGDFGSILGNVTSSLGQSLMDLTLNNPAKNALLGTNYGTLADIMNRPAGGLMSAFSGQNIGAMNVQAATVIVNGGSASGMAGLGGLFAGASNDNKPMSLYRDAIAAIESGGRYGALGPVTASGDRAYGRYQVMGANVGPWTEQTLGYAMSPSAFLSSPKAQDAVFDKIFGGYLSRYGNANDAASTWFTGRPLATGGSAADILGTTGTSYVQKFNTALSQLTDTTGLATDGLGTLGNGLNQFGGLLSSYQPSGGTGGGLFSSLTSLFGGGQKSQLQIAQSNVAAGIWAGLYDGGGYTGPGGVHEPAGVVHKGEVVWSQLDIARAGGVQVVEAMRLGRRGYASGGVVESLPFSMPARNDNAGPSARPSIAISISLEGAQGDRAIEDKARQSAYAGMKQALEEYDAHFNDKVAAAVDRPRWR